MGKYKEMIDRLVRERDEETGRMLESSGRPAKLCLLGDPEAPFLRGLRKKAEKMGFEVVTQDESGVPYVEDRETYEYGFLETDGVDIDAGSKYCMTAASEAMLRIIEESGLERQTVCIVGRGPATKGLARALLERDHTVTVCHSKTHPLVLDPMMDDCDILVLATPRLSLPLNPVWVEADLILDIGGCAKSLEQEEGYVSGREIGRLTNAILLNRLAREVAAL